MLPCRAILTIILPGIFTRMNQKTTKTKPMTEAVLVEKAEKMAGHNLETLARWVGQELPANYLHHKGWTGCMVEDWLGATAGSDSEPDFPHLGIELKTLPLRTNGCPKETTFVCMVPIMGIGRMQWRDSSVYKKLAKVLWVPIEGDRSIPIPQRRIGMPLLWEMPTEVEQVLRQDWEEFAEQICLGQIDRITAHQGRYLQIRPKAANAKARCDGINSEGEITKTLPRGFYLRTSFTQLILKAHYQDNMST